MLAYFLDKESNRVAVFPSTEPSQKIIEVTGAVEMEVEQGYDGNWYVAGYAPKKSEEQKQKEAIEAAYDALDANVEKRLNDFAATRRYASIYTACNARDSQIAKYAAEGAYCFKMWGKTYAKCEELLAEYMPDVLAGKRPIPTWEEIETQLPALVWPDDQHITQ